MEKTYVEKVGKSTGDTAVDGLAAGLAAGLAMALFLATAGFAGGTSPLTTMGYFDPAQTGNWLTGLVAHLAVSAIYGVVFALLLRLLGWIRQSLAKLAWLWGIVYGLLLVAVAYEVLFTAVDSPLSRIAAWQFGAAHLVFGLVSGWRLQINQ